MADIEKRVDKLEEKVAQLELDINKSLGQIQSDLAEIKTCVKSTAENDNLKNKIIEKDVKNNTQRIEKLEQIVSKVCWTVALAIITLIGGALIYYIKNGI